MNVEHLSGPVTRLALRVWLCALWLPALAAAQGFGGLGTEAGDFDAPRPGVALEFPRDHGAHPGFRIEWWYLTANLKGEDGREYGIQWTLFRTALSRSSGTGWNSPQIWMGHAALTGAEFHYTAERLARGGIGQAGVRIAPFLAHIDDWEMAGAPDRGLDVLKLNARGLDFSYALELEAEGPLVLHGQEGYSVKSREGQASYYYSQPAYRISGQIETEAGVVSVTGHGWLDREWSSQPLSADQQGWDWFSLSFDEGAKLMAFRLRGSGGDFGSATWIAADGAATTLPDGAVRATPLRMARVAGREVPVEWRLEVPGREVDVTLVALNSQSWMPMRFAYWEGPVSVRGSHTGQGYLEMTGYE